MERMKCNKCQSEMQLGRLLSDGMVWTGSEKFSNIKETVISGIESLPAYGIVAYRCPNCKTLELYTPENEKA